MRQLVDAAEGRISKELLLRIAEDYEAFADSIEQRPNRFLPPEDVVPAEVRKFGTRTRSVGTAPSLVPEQDIPKFLKRTPASASEPSDDDEK
ncbi:MAG: hypothetical protein K2Y71_01335 [Xanthobacteraceae bacterium]|nr:hypothetical protein [Xanthobacteraceae bacterium]